MIEVHTLLNICIEKVPNLPAVKQSGRVDLFMMNRRHLASGGETLYQFDSYAQSLISLPWNIQDSSSVSSLETQYSELWISNRTVLVFQTHVFHFHTYTFKNAKLHISNSRVERNVMCYDLVTNSIASTRRDTYLNEKHLAYVTVEIYVQQDEADEEDENIWKLKIPFPFLSTTWLIRVISLMLHVMKY